MTKAVPVKGCVCEGVANCLGHGVNGEEEHEEYELCPKLFL
jgi:hypothetical protein